MAYDPCADCGLTNGECGCPPDVEASDPHDDDDEFEWQDEPGDLAYEGNW